MEQLAERDVHQPEDDGERVHRVERRVELPVEPEARHGEEQAGDRHGEQAGEGEEVAAALDRQRARVAQPAAQEDEHAGEHEHGGDVEGVEDRTSRATLSASKLQRADARHVHLVAVGLLADALEVEEPRVSGKVTRAARMQPQNTSWWASQRVRERRRMNPWARRWVPTRPGSAARLRALRWRKASQPRRLSIAVGGRRTHTA